MEIVDFPNKNGDFPLQTVSSPEGNRSHPWSWRCVVTVMLGWKGISQCGVPVVPVGQTPIGSMVYMGK